MPRLPVGLPWAWRRPSASSSSSYLSKRVWCSSHSCRATPCCSPPVCSPLPMPRPARPRCRCSGCCRWSGAPRLSATSATLLGYFFGNIPAVQDHFELVIVLILLVSLAPTIIGLFKAKFGKKKPAKVTDAQLDVMEDGIKNLDK